MLINLLNQFSWMQHSTAKSLQIYIDNCIIIHENVIYLLIKNDTE